MNFRIRPLSELTTDLMEHAPRLFRRNALSGGWPLSLILLIMVGFITAYPVALMFLQTFASDVSGQGEAWSLQNWTLAFGDENLIPTLSNTFSLAIIRIVITTVLAIFFAWVITRTDTPFKGMIEFALWLGFFLPQLPMTMGWVLLLDSHQGLLNQALMDIFGLPTAPLNVFSYWGIVWCHLAFSTSVRFMLITPAFRAMDAALEEAARTSGSSATGALLRIVIPVLAPVLIASTGLGFIKSLESFEIELVIGIPAGIYVVPTRIYDFVHWEPARYGSATALASIFLAFIFVLMWVQNAVLGRKSYTTVTGRGFRAQPLALGGWRWLTFSICLFFILLMIVLPLATLILGTFMTVFGFFNLPSTWTFRHWTTVFNDPIFVRSLLNTLQLGAGAAICGTLLYVVISYFIVRTHLPGRNLMNFFCWLPWAMPGLLISLALLWMVLGESSPLRPLYGSVALLSLAIIIKEMPLGTQVIKAGLLQVSSELEEASVVAGASWLFTFRRILLPLLSPMLVAVGLIVFIVAIREISAIIFLSPTGSRTMSLLMLDYMVEFDREKAAVIGLVLVAFTTVLAVALRFLRLRLNPASN